MEKEKYFEKKMQQISNFRFKNACVGWTSAKYIRIFICFLDTFFVLSYP